MLYQHAEFTRVYHRFVCVCRSAEGELRLWKLDTARSTVLAAAHDSSVLSVAFLQAHDAVVSSSRDGVVKLWNVAKAQHSFTAACCTAEVRSYAHHFCNATVDSTMEHPDLIWTPSIDASKVCLAKTAS